MDFYGQLGAPTGLEAVVPGFRSLQGIVPTAEELAAEVQSAKDTKAMRWGFFTVAAAVVGVFVVYQEMKK